MQTVNRQEIFSHLKARLTLVDKNIDLIWCADLFSMKNIAVNHFQDENYIFLNFGECLIFNHFKIKLSTSKTTDKGLKFTEIGGALNNIEEARELHNQFEQILGLADHFSESYGEIFTYWESDDNKISIYPRHHTGGEWFEYKIMTKNCR